MNDRILVTGGAGFIGSHVVDELLASGYRVRVFDDLVEQVHLQGRVVPEYLSSETEFVRGDVCDAGAVRAALDDVDAVVHLAAAVGVGQSMYEIGKYFEANDIGTAVVLEALVSRPVRRLVVASSMSIYGEGAYRSADGGAPPDVVRRSRRQLEAQDWEPRDADGRILEPVPTPESKHPDLASIYALTKYDQERMCMMIGDAYNIPAIALRFFNTYGPRQALSNPYTGVLAIFAARYLNNRAPIIFEDGSQRRDFVSVHDVARAVRLAVDADSSVTGAFNVGSGAPRTIAEVAGEVAAVLGKETLEPEVVGQYRIGDIRHCFADLSRSQEILGYSPQVGFREGLEELATWLQDQEAADNIDDARSELAARGLTLGAA